MANRCASSRTRCSRYSPSLLRGRITGYSSPGSSEGLYLLQRVRDEAHRFAIAYHRQKRGKAATASALDDVPGLGPARRATLLKHFGSVRKLRAASVEEIAAVPGIGPKLAATVAASLGSNSADLSGGTHPPRPPLRGPHEDG